MKDKIIKFFNVTYSDIKDSTAYDLYCEKVYGKALKQYNRMDMYQLERILAVLDIKENSKVLDLGCGLGEISRFLLGPNAIKFFVDAPSILANEVLATLCPTCELNFKNMAAAKGNSMQVKNVLDLLWESLQ